MKIFKCLYVFMPAYVLMPILAHASWYILILHTL